MFDFGFFFPEWPPWYVSHLHFFGNRQKPCQKHREILLQVYGSSSPQSKIDQPSSSPGGGDSDARERSVQVQQIRKGIGNAVQTVSAGAPKICQDQLPLHSSIQTVWSDEILSIINGASNCHYLCVGLIPSASWESRADGSRADRRSLCHCERCRSETWMFRRFWSSKPASYGARNSCGNGRENPPSKSRCTFLPWAETVAARVCIDGRSRYLIEPECMQQTIAAGLWCFGGWREFLLARKSVVPVMILSLLYYLLVSMIFF